jgi:Asp-tRNA(Asn)/Glu-tRNA(Gln) amidotransferase A subunit family amidase
MYDAQAMDGLPVGVQIVAKRLEEEKLMEGMKIVQSAMVTDGKGYQLLEV